jgi:3-phosphoshikimate 1-carboxyvinyltransferase
MAPFPDKLAVAPVRTPPRATVRVPGSKSITNRALVLAALGSFRSGCVLHGVLRSEDTEVMVEALRALGFRVRPDWGGPDPSIHLDHLPPGPSRIPATAADLFLANSGTSMRFLTALVSLGRGRFRLDGVARMRERPIEDLLAALRQLGVPAASEHGNGCPPVVVEARGLSGGSVRIRGDVSSQFLSGLLMACPLAAGDTTVAVDGPLVSVPYVTMTLAMVRQFGGRVEAELPARFVIRGNQAYEAARYDVEPDASAAAYFFAAAAVTGGEVHVPGLTPAGLQGDVRFVELLEAMGCRVTREGDGLTVRGGPLRGIDVDMNDVSDCVMTLAAVACFARGPTVIRNVAHVRHKETDRLQALAAELRRLGAGVEERADGLTVTPGALHGAEVCTYQDHRMAMSLALVGLRVPGVVIADPDCVAKTYPGFFNDLGSLYHGGAGGDPP